MLPNALADFPLPSSIDKPAMPVWYNASATSSAAPSPAGSTTNLPAQVKPQPTAQPATQAPATVAAPQKKMSSWWGGWPWSGKLGGEVMGWTPKDSKH